MKKHFHNPPPSAESMTFLTFGQMAACVAAFTALFIVAVFVSLRDKDETVQRPTSHPSKP